MLDAQGKPVTYGAAGYRYYWNRNHPDAAAFYRKLVRFLRQRNQDRPGPLRQLHRRARLRSGLDRPVPQVPPRDVHAAAVVANDDRRSGGRPAARGRSPAAAGAGLAGFLLPLAGRILLDDGPIRPFAAAGRAGGVQSQRRWRPRFVRRSITGGCCKAARRSGWKAAAWA